MGQLCPRRLRLNLVSPLFSTPYFLHHSCNSKTILTVQVSCNLSFHLFLTSFVHADLPLDRGQRRQVDDFADPPAQGMSGTAVGLYHEQGAKASPYTSGGLPPLAFLDFNRRRRDLRPPPVARANFGLASLASALPSASPSIPRQCICSFPCKY